MNQQKVFMKVLNSNTISFEEEFNQCQSEYQQYQQSFIIQCFIHNENNMQEGNNNIEGYQIATVEQ